MVKEYLEQAVKNIEMEKERQVSAVRERIMREKIIPYNADVDQSRAKALAELDNELNTKFLELRQAYDLKKQELVRLSEENKKENAEKLVATELAVLTIEYDKAIAKLNSQIAEIEG